MALIYDNSTSPTVTVTTIDSSGSTVDTLTQGVTNTTANSNVQRVYYKVNGTSGAHAVKVHFTSNTGYVGVIISEFYGVDTSGTPTSGTALCNRVSSTSVTTGNITVASGGLLIQSMFPDDTTASGALTAGSSMTFAITDRYTSEAVQYRLGTGSAINPTITQGTSHQTASCAIGFKAATAGTTPSATPRILRLGDAQFPTGAANPFVAQVPISGNSAVLVYHSGGDTITGVTDTGSNTWTCTSASAGTGNASQICRATITSASNTLAISVTRNATTSDGSIMVYDTTGLDASSFDADSGSLTGNQASQPSTFTTCSSCITPTTASGIAFFVSGWDFCTAFGATAPSGSLFDSATYRNNSLDGPQQVDQNNGWEHYKYSSTAALSSTWTMECDATNIGNWAGRAVAIKAQSGASGVRRRVIIQ